MQGIAFDNASALLSLSSPPSRLGNQPDNTGMLFSRSIFFSNQIPIVKRVSTFRAEFRRMRRISRFPATLVTFVLRNTSGLRFATLRAELPFVHSSAAARPTIYLHFWLFRSAFRTEFPDHLCAALQTFPASSCRLRLWLFAAAIRAEVSGNTALSTRAIPSV